MAGFYWLKGTTAHRAKAILNLISASFWRDKSYDVKAGWVRSVEEWPWSSASQIQIGDTQTARPSAPLAFLLSDRKI
jgi:hypothetical protein